MRRLRAEAAGLSALRVPDGVGQLDADLAASRSALRALKEAERAAEDADTAARADAGRRPAASTAGTRPHAPRRAREAPGSAPGPRGGRHSPGRARRAASAAVETAAADPGRDPGPPRRGDPCGRDAPWNASPRWASSTPSSPRCPSRPGSAELDERRAELAGAVSAAAAALEEAERAETSAREARAAAAPEAPLARAARDLGDLRSLLADVAVAEQRRHARRRRAAGGRRRLVRRRADPGGARQRTSTRHGARTSSPACARTWSRGSPARCASRPSRHCPPRCRPMRSTRPRPAWPKRTAPSPPHGPPRVRPTAAAAKAEAYAAGSAKRRTALADDLAGLLSGPLADFPLPAARTTVAALTGSGVSVDQGTDQAAVDWLAAAHSEVTAPGARSGARRAGRGARRRRGQAGSRAAPRGAGGRDQGGERPGQCGDGTAPARDPLVELGAPSVDGLGLAGRLDGAGRLGGGAGHGQGRPRSLRHGTRRRPPSGERKRLAAAFDDAERTLARQRAVAKAASEDDQDARFKLSRTTTRIAELGELLRDAPDDEQITEQLARRDRLEAAATAAGTALRAARAERSKSETTLATLEDTERAARGQLSAARDRVVALGAPALDGHGLLDGWTELVTWASGEVKLREQEAEAAAAEADAARAAIGELTHELALDLAEAGIDLAAETLRYVGRRGGDRRARGGTGDHAAHRGTPVAGRRPRRQAADGARGAAGRAYARQPAAGQAVPAVAGQRGARRPGGGRLADPRRAVRAASST